jgi:hypothetical protein
MATATGFTLKKLDGIAGFPRHAVIDADGRRIGRIEKMDGFDYRGFYRFRAEVGLLSGLYVSLAGKRERALAEGIRATLEGEAAAEHALATGKGRNGVVTEYEIIEEIGRLRAEIDKLAREEDSPKASAPLLRMLGIRSYLIDMLVERGYDRSTIIRFAHGNTEKWSR